jgi:hypothetical protein
MVGDAGRAKYLTVFGQIIIFLLLHRENLMLTTRPALQVTQYLCVIRLSPTIGDLRLQFAYVEQSLAQNN